ncbi:4-hydroxythreonine-4-phosphate dehydrogenase PdxA [Pontivivens ytuae]|uniref:4-hydroxythreonine-4-phosphate dehydrogenase n=1 Tax=Pontivivens ytuae TaxID=2789856 RepID=A0A7S9LRE4_9RHOB|nr:4-hydroxythreonine-4-phosphate dehydrogenase PdxA [Pontivivens ytuae]QPH53909.1 4-hydroxythreonine-4-phosphate dehydrogenase PdxA [Pontivivens ytuae]
MTLVLSLGDPAGVGPELAVRAWAEGAGPFTALGSADHLEKLGATVARVDAPDATPWPEALPVIDIPLAEDVTPGTPSLANAPAVVEAINRGVQLCLDGHASALVTAPIAKWVLKEGAGFAHPGHTEFLAHLSGAPRPVMMLAGPELRVVPVTIHIPIADVPAALTPELLEETIRVTHAGLIRDFGVPTPRLAIAGLNPHAGEGGVMGREEIETLTPVLDRLQAEGFDLTAPLPADTMFHPAARARYDAAICMYHDQALVPLKTLSFDDGVNVTLGLPFIRTSPDHGTAFDIAGTGRARPDSLIAAIRLAQEMAARRA